MTLIQALVWNAGSLNNGDKGKNQVGSTCKAITNTFLGGGSTRRSN
jgi:hypothetical protein